MALAGRIILTLTLLFTLVGPIYADWNETHIFKDRWPSHARFHGVVSVSMAVILSIFGLWELWAAGLRGIAAAIPIAYWGSFFVALAVPGVAVEDPPHLVARLRGVPINVV